MGVLRGSYSSDSDHKLNHNKRPIFYRSLTMAPLKGALPKAELEAGVGPGGNDGRSRAGQLRVLSMWWSSEMGRLACSEWQAALPTRRILGDSSPGPGPGTRIEDINVTVTVTMRRRRQLKSLRRRQVPDAPLIMQAALPVPGSRAKRLICGPQALRRTVGYALNFIKKRS